MPHCTKCGALKTRLNEKNLRSDCNKVQVNDNTQSDQINAVDGNKSLSELNCENLVEIIKTAIKPLADKADNREFTQRQGYDYDYVNGRIKLHYFTGIPFKSYRNPFYITVKQQITVIAI